MKVLARASPRLEPADDDADRDQVDHPLPWWRRSPCRRRRVQGRTIAMVVSTGNAGRRCWRRPALPSTGLPIGESAPPGRVPFQSGEMLDDHTAQQRRIDVTDRDDRRALRAIPALVKRPCTVLGVARVSVSTVPIGSRCGDSGHANGEHQVEHRVLQAHLRPRLLALFGRRTTGRSESRIFWVICGPDIMPARILKLSSSPAGDVTGRSSL